MKVLVVDDGHVPDVALSRVIDRLGLPARRLRSTDAAVSARSSCNLVLINHGTLELHISEVVQRLRKDGVRAPILAIGREADVSGRLEGFRAGVDDWVAAPPEVEEVVAKVRALMRLFRTLPVIEIQDLVINPAFRSVSRAGRRIHLTPREFDVLLCLADSAGTPVSREDLLARVWGITTRPESKVLEVQISRLRKKIDFTEPSLIHTCESSYRLVPIYRTVFSKTSVSSAPDQTGLGPPCVYEIDQNDVIYNVSGAWSEFEQRFLPTDWRDERVVGSSLWQHLSGDAVKRAYQRFLRAVRGQPVEFQVRCECSTQRVPGILDIRIQRTTEEGAVCFVARPSRGLLAGGENEILAAEDHCSFCGADCGDTGPPWGPCPQCQVKLDTLLESVGATGL